MAFSNAFWWSLAAVAAAVLLPTGGGPLPIRWQQLASLHPQARERFVALFHAIEAAGYQVVPTSGYRAGDTLDFHYFGLAQDFNLIELATGKWYRAADKFDKATWEATGVPAIIRAHGFRWGGDFITPWVYKGVTHPGYDPIHADLGKSYMISGLRAKALLLAKNTPLPQFDGRKVPLTA